MSALVGGTNGKNATCEHERRNAQNFGENAQSSIFAIWAEGTLYANPRIIDSLFKRGLAQGGARKRFIAIRLIINARIGWAHDRQEPRNHSILHNVIQNGSSFPILQFTS